MAYTHDQLAILLGKANGYSDADARRWAGTKVPDTLAAIALAESSGNSTVVGSPNSNGSRDYGLWQINDKAWSGDKEIRKICAGAPFATAMLDPMKNARAALWVYKEQGYTAWAAYNSGSYKKFLKGSSSAESPGFVGGVAAEAAKDAIPDPVQKALNYVTKLLPVLGFGAVGILVTILGIILLLFSNKQVRQVTKTVAKVAA